MASFLSFSPTRCGIPRRWTAQQSARLGHIPCAKGYMASKLQGSQDLLA